MKQEIIDKTIEYILQNGIYTLSLRPLAKSMGTSDRMILYYFKTKEELIHFVIKVLTDKIICELNNEIRKNDAKTIHELMHVIWKVFTKKKNLPLVITFYEIQILSLRSSSKSFRQTAKFLVDQWEYTVKELIIPFGFKNSDIDSIVSRICAELKGLHQTYLISKKREVFHSINRLCVDIENLKHE